MARCLINSYCSNERTTHHGDYFCADDASMLPAPVRGHMPMWIGGVGEKRTLRIVAEHATGWNAAYVSAAEYARLGRILDQHCERAGRDPTSVERSINLMFNLGIDDRAAAAAEAGLAAQWGPMWNAYLPERYLAPPSQPSIESWSIARPVPTW